MKDLFIFWLLKLTKYFFVVVGFILMAITTGFVFCYYLCEGTIEALDIKIKNYERESNTNKD